MENIHGYVKRKKKPPLTFNLVNSWVFRYQGKRANQVSLFDTNMKPQKYCFSSGFFRAVERMIDVDIYGRIHVLTFYVSVKSKLQHAPPGQPPGHLTFLKIIVQIPPYPGQNAVQMPHTRVHSGDQNVPTPGTFHRHKNDRRTAETPSVVEQNIYKYNKN